ncbi:MAG: sugar kinase [Dehalococcoidia bacterium]|nr:sugar kinase [Dehalococcoidia bacterium]MQG09689.1 sugar kinase [SAR202 cluster bacterium]
MSLLVVGSIAYDSVETPSGKREDQLGGSGCFFSVAASYFTEVSIIGVIGKDFNDSDLRFLQEKNIDISGIEKTDGKTFRWTGEYMDDINTAVTLETQLNVFGNFNPKISNQHSKKPYLFLANIDPEIQNKVLESMNVKPKFVACDTMNLWIDIKKNELLDLISKVDMLFINHEESKQLTSEDNSINIYEKVKTYGSNNLVIKLGEFGAKLFSKSNIFSAPAFPVENVVDPTGAGDSFAGGFMGYIAKHGEIDSETLKTATIVGSTMASFAVEDFGINRFKNLKQSDIKDRFEEFSKLTYFNPMHKQQT